MFSYLYYKGIVLTITNKEKHIDKNQVPHTGAGTMALYMRNKLKELVIAPSGIAQLDDNHPSALQLIVGNELCNMNVFYKGDGVVSQIVIEQGAAGPTAIFVANEQFPEVDQLNENFIMVLALSLFPPMKGVL